MAMKTKRKKKQGKPDPAIVADLVKRISDYDLLVIKGGKYNYWRMYDKIDEHLSGKDAAVDVVLATPEVVERYRNSHCLVYCPALKEGKVVYDSQASAAERSSRMAKSRARKPGLGRVSHPRGVS
jgi:hypothetical protein